MKNLTFATTDTKTLCKITESITTTPLFLIRGITPLFWMTGGRESLLSHYSYITYDEKHSVYFIKYDKQVNIALWMVDKTYFISYEIVKPDMPFAMLEAFVTIMRVTKRRDLPVKIDHGDTISIKGAAAVAALAVAQGGFGGIDGIVWDMARDNKL